MGPERTETNRHGLSGDYSARTNSGNGGNPPEPQSHQSIEGSRAHRRESQNLGTIKVHRQHIYAFFFNHATHGRPSFVSGLGLAAILLRDEHHEKCGQYFKCIMEASANGVLQRPPVHSHCRIRGRSEHGDAARPQQHTIAARRQRTVRGGIGGYPLTIIIFECSQECLLQLRKSQLGQ